MKKQQTSTREWQRKQTKENDKKTTTKAISCFLCLNLIRSTEKMIHFNSNIRLNLEAWPLHDNSARSNAATMPYTFTAIWCKSTETIERLEEKLDEYEKKMILILILLRSMLLFAWHHILWSLKCILEWMYTKRMHVVECVRVWVWVC